MSILCFLGFHKWEAESYREGDEIITRNRCIRRGCPRYGKWTFVNAERIQSWRNPW